MQQPPPPASTGVHAASDASAPLENELRELVTKMQQSFTQLIHHSAAIIGESVEDKNALIDESEGADADLAHLLEIGGQSSGSGGGGGSGAGLSADKLKPVPPRKSLPVQKLSYSQLQTSALKQTYQTSVNANNLVHHTHSLLGLVARLKLSVLLAQSAQDAARQGKTGNAPESPEAAAQSSLRHPLEAAIHPGAIPAHLLPLHMQRTQQQLHDSGLELYAQVCEIDRQLEDAALDAEDAKVAKANTEDAAITDSRMIGSSCPAASRSAI